MGFFGPAIHINIELPLGDCVVSVGFLGCTEAGSSVVDIPPVIVEFFYRIRHISSGRIHAVVDQSFFKRDLLD